MMQRSGGTMLRCRSEPGWLQKANVLREGGGRLMCRRLAKDWVPNGKRWRWLRRVVWSRRLHATRLK